MDLIKASSWHGIWAGTGVGVLLDCLVACMHALDLELWSCLRVRAMPFLLLVVDSTVDECHFGPNWDLNFANLFLLFVTAICCHSFLECLFHGDIMNGPVSDLSKLLSVTRDPPG